MLIEIKPMDTLFFKDSKPFITGLDNWSDGKFPPYPFTLYGALRTSFLYISEDFRRNSGIVDSEGDPTKDLVIKKVLYKDTSSDGVYLLPSPYDCVFDEYKAKSSEERVHLHPVNLRKNAFYTNVNFDYFVGEKLKDYSKKRRFKHVPSCYLDTASYNKYLNNKISSSSHLSQSRYLKTECKVVISVSNETKSAEEGRLYRVGLNRLDDFSIMVEYEGISEKLSNKLSVMRLGGEGKTAKVVHVTKANKQLAIKPPKFDPKNRHFKLILSTPSYFSQGWLPSWIDSSTMEGELPIKGDEKIRVKLISTALGKPQNVSGFDLRMGRPKPMKRFVPAGSIYYFEVLNDSFKWDDVLKLHGASITDSYGDYNYEKAGVGLCYVGKYSLDEK